MRFPALRRLFPLFTATTLAMSVSACDPNEVLTADPALAPLVGDWEATTLLLSNPDGLGTPVDALALGLTFTMNIQPSGLYTVIATATGFAGTEIGRLTVDGDVMTLARDFPTIGVSTAFYEVSGDTLRMTGTTTIGLLPGTDSEAGLEMEMLRRAPAT